MGTVTNVEEHGGPSMTATTISPGTPISGGTGSFTTLAASSAFTLTGTHGDAFIGASGQSGKLQFANGGGAFTAYIGWASALQQQVFEVASTGADGFVRVSVARSVSGNGEAFRVSARQDGSISVGNIQPTARCHLPAGTAAAGRAPLKINSGPLNTTPEAGAVEFLTNDLYYTGTDGVRRRLAANGDVIALKAFTVATLPAGTVGDRAYVTDATTPTYNGALTGGGTVHVPVFRNATGWVSA